MRDFDDILNCLRRKRAFFDPNCTIIFNCQMGQGRTTTGMVIRYLIAENLNIMPNLTDAEKPPQPQRISLHDSPPNWELPSSTSTPTTTQSGMFGNGSQLEAMQRFDRGEYSIVMSHLIRVLSNDSCGGVEVKRLVDKGR